MYEYQRNNNEFVKNEMQISIYFTKIFNLKHHIFIIEHGNLKVQTIAYKSLLLSAISRKQASAIKILRRKIVFY